MKIDMNSPVIPGKMAAGIELMTHINEIDNIGNFKIEPVDNKSFPTMDLGTMYESDCVAFLVKKDTIYRIMVYENYKGKLLGKIGLGATLKDIEKEIGPWDEDEEDNLILKDIPGIIFTLKHHDRKLDRQCFNKEMLYIGPGWCLDCPNAPIIEMCIYDPDVTEREISDFRRAQVDIKRAILDKNGS